MSFQGKIKSINIVPNGAELDQAAALGATTLFLSNIDDFDEDGGSVSMDGDVSVTYLTVGETEDFALDAEGEQNPPTCTMTLSAPTPRAYGEGVRVDLVPYSEEKIAQVLLTGNEDEPVEVRVPHELSGLLEDGVRTDGVEETVVVDTDDTGDLVIVSVVGEQAKFLAKQVQIDTDNKISDDTPPPASPTPELTGGIGYLTGQWEAVINNDLVYYDVYLSTVDDFAPTLAEFIGTTTSTSVAINRDAAGLPLVYDTSYYMKIIARDEDGPALPGEQDSAQLRQVTGPDVSATYVYAGEVQAEKIKSGEVRTVLTLSGIIRTAESGARVEISAEGIKVYNPSGTNTSYLLNNGDARFDGDVIAQTLTVMGGMTIFGTNNKIERGALVKLGEKLQNPTTPPSVTIDWANVTLTGYDFAGLGVTPTGIQWDATNTRWVVACTTGYGYQDVTFLGFDVAGNFLSTIATVSFPGVFQVLPPPVAGVRLAGPRYIGLFGDYLYDSAGSSHSYYTHTRLDTTRTPVLSTDGIYFWVSEIYASKIRSTKYDPNEVAGSNLVVNGTFDVNLTGWSLFDANTTLATDGSSPRTGAGAMRMTRVNSSGTMRARNANFAVTANKAYDFTSYVKPLTRPGVGQIKIVWLTSGGTVISTSAHPTGLYNTVPVGAYAACTVKGVAPPTATQAYLELSFSGGLSPGNTPQVGDQVLWDDVSGQKSAGIQYVSVIDLDATSPFTDLASGTGIQAVAMDGTNFGGQFAGTRYLASYKLATGVNEVHTFTTAAGFAEQVNESFPHPDGGSVVDIAWNGTNFYTLTSDLKVHRHENSTKWTTETNKWWASYNLYDGGSDGTGDHSTPDSPRVGFTMKKRARLTLTAPAIGTSAPGVDDPDSVAWFLGRLAGTTAPSTANMWYNGISAPPGVGQPIQSNIPNPVFTGTSNPPTVSDFPGTTPGRLVSEKEYTAGNPQIDLKGDGSFRLGDLVGSALGRLTIDGTKLSDLSPKSFQMGNVVVTVGASTDTGTEPVTFPLGTMAGTPRVIVMQRQGTPHFYAGWAGGVTNAGFTMNAAKTGTSGSNTISCDWYAFLD